MTLSGIMDFGNDSSEKGNMAWSEAFRGDRSIKIRVLSDI
jgi:hypothetical protein